MQHRHAAWTYSIDKQHGQAASTVHTEWIHSKVMQHVHIAPTCNMDMQYGEAAWICSMNMQQ
jgi:hypothetical protein